MQRDHEFHLGSTEDGAECKVVDWDQTRTEQGSSTKTIVNLGFKSDTNLATMIGMPGIVTDELKMVPYKLHDQVVSARLDMSPKCFVLRRLQSSEWR